MVNRNAMPPVIVAEDEEDDEEDEEEDKPGVPDWDAAEPYSESNNAQDRN